MSELLSLGHFQTVLADPPWHFQNATGRASTPEPTLRSSAKTRDRDPRLRKHAINCSKIFDVTTIAIVARMLAGLARGTMMLDDLNIVLLVAGGPDLKTLMGRGPAIFDQHLAALEGQVIAGRQVVRNGLQGGEIIWNVEVIDPEIHECFLLGLMDAACKDLDAALGGFSAEVNVRMWQMFDAAEDRAGFYREMVEYGVEISACAKRRH